MFATVINVFQGGIQSPKTATANWITVFIHQLKLVFLADDAVIRNRAVACLIPPVIFLLLITLLSLVLLSRPRTTARVITKLTPLFPWVIAAVGIGIFAIIARPALWDHTCTHDPIRIQPGDRAQWQEIWLQLNRPMNEEPAWKYRSRMESDLDTWATREASSEDLEEFVNLSAQAIATRDCLHQKDQIFRDSIEVAKTKWISDAFELWSRSPLQQWWLQAMMFTETCQPEARSSRWEGLMRKAGIRS